MEGKIPNHTKLNWPGIYQVQGDLSLQTCELLIWTTSVDPKRHMGEWEGRIAKV
jgi:hypothetical protein